MIEPWQVWLASLSPVTGHEQGGTRPVVIVGSEQHLRINQGRMVTCLPLTNTDRRVRNHIPIENAEGKPTFVMTEQLRTISTLRFQRTEPWWELHDDEVAAVRRALRYMVDF